MMIVNQRSLCEGCTGMTSRSTDSGVHACQDWVQFLRRYYDITTDFAEEHLNWSCELAVPPAECQALGVYIKAFKFHYRCPKWAIVLKGPRPIF